MDEEAEPLDLSIIYMLKRQPPDRADVWGWDTLIASDEGRWNDWGSGQAVTVLLPRHVP